MKYVWCMGVFLYVCTFIDDQPMWTPLWGDAMRLVIDGSNETQTDERIMPVSTEYIFSFDNRFSCGQSIIKYGG